MDSLKVLREFRDIRYCRKCKGISNHIVKAMGIGIDNNSKEVIDDIDHLNIKCTMCGKERNV